MSDIPFCAMAACHCSQIQRPARFPLSANIGLRPWARYNAITIHSFHRFALDIIQSDYKRHGDSVFRITEQHNSTPPKPYPDWRRYLRGNRSNRDDRSKSIYEQRHTTEPHTCTHHPQRRFHQLQPQCSGLRTTQRMRPTTVCPESSCSTEAAQIHAFSAHKPA